MSDAPPDVGACVFDAYGTLFDVHSATRRHADAVGPDADAVSQLWRTKQLEYTWLRSLMGRYVDFWQVTTDALDIALDTHGIRDPEVRERLLDAYRELEAYPEVPGVLAELGAMGVPCAVLSNGSPAMLDDAVRAAGVRDALAEVLSVDGLGVFKPDPRVYQLAVDRLGVPAASICFLSSNAWDAVGATSFGMRVAWVNRLGRPPERLGHAPAHELADLSGLPALVKELRGG